MPDGFGGFDPFTGFGGPYALQPRSAGRGLGTKPPAFHPSYSGPVGGRVNPMLFGAGISAIGEVASSVKGGAFATGQAMVAHRIRQQGRDPRMFPPGGVSAAYHGQPMSLIRNRSLAFINARLPGHQPFSATGAEAGPDAEEGEDEQYQPQGMGPPTTPILRSRTQMFHPVSPQSSAVRSHIRYQQMRHM